MDKGDTVVIKLLRWTGKPWLAHLNQNITM